MLKSLTRIIFVVSIGVFSSVALGQLDPTHSGLTGYFSTSPDASSEIRQDGWGMSMYSAVYPLKPGKDDWTQLGWGTWMVPNRYEDENGEWNEQPKNEDGSYISFCPDPTDGGQFQSNEGGSGTWGNVQFPIEQPMFLIAATADCYNSGVGGPAYWPAGQTALDEESLYFAQLSNRVLLPPGPVIFENTTEPRLFGYGWIALPIIPENASPYGIPTGRNSWTLFMNSSNFKGPVGFFTPAFWTAINKGQEPPLSVGFGFDTRNNMGGALAMEVGFTNSFSASHETGEYRRVPRLTFGADEGGRAVLAQDFNRYFKGAIWDKFEAWVNGGTVPDQMDPSGIWHSEMTHADTGLRMLDESVEIEFGSILQTTVFETSGGGSAFGLQWDGTLETGVIPEYYKKIEGMWVPISESEVPDGTLLKEQTFPELPVGSAPDLDTSNESPWASSGWSAGPFSTELGNGSVVDYVWYRFVDQPAISRLGLSDEQKAGLQAWAESLHDQGTDGLTIPPPTSGQLVSLDSGLIVTPPSGLSRGYVPIAIGQRASTEKIFSSGFEASEE